MLLKSGFWLFIFLVMIFVIGLWGQTIVSPDSDGISDYLDALYKILLLFFFAGEWTMELTDVPWQIEVVRFLAPLSAVFSLIIVFTANARNRLNNYFVQFKSGHIIVVGLGVRSWQFLRTCRNKDSVVVIERDPENILVGRVRELGISVVVADIFEDGLFNRINLKLASDLIAFTGNDGTNVEVAIKSRDFVKSNSVGTHHIRIQIHLNEIELAHQLADYPKFFSDYPVTDISFFSVYDLSARRLLKEYPPEIFADAAGHDRVHLAIYGFERLATKLMIEASLLCHYANSSRLRFTIFDVDAQNKELRLRSEYPFLARICDFEFIQQSSFGPHVFAGELVDRLPSITLHIICRDTDEENLSHALTLRAALLERRSSNAPILVRMQQSSGLAQLLESDTGEPEIPDGLYPFGMLDQILHADNILTDQLDELARSIQAVFSSFQTGQQDLSQQPSNLSWENIPQWQRKQNLTKADHLEIRLRAIRYRLGMESSKIASLSDGEAVALTLMDHNRWLNEKIYDGWQYGEERVEEAKINPLLVAWNDLATPQMEKEVNETRAEPDHFAKHTGYYYQPVFVIGVSGHRLAKLDVNNQRLIRKIVETLEGIRNKYPNHHFLVLSPLAEGADRLVAQLAMDVLGATLHVPLPLPYDLYVSDFESSDSVEQFKTMVGQAEYYFEMPMRFGNFRELAAPYSVENEARNNQYALAGAYTIQRCDLLVAIYDGEPEAGTGGTGQVVKWYNEGGIPADFLYPSNYYLESRKQPAIIINPYP